jgi:hypothetical protein
MGDTRCIFLKSLDLSTVAVLSVVPLTLPVVTAAHLNYMLQVVTATHVPLALQVVAAAHVPLALQVVTAAHIPLALQVVTAAHVPLALQVVAAAHLNHMPLTLPAHLNHSERKPILRCCGQNGRNNAFQMAMAYPLILEKPQWRPHPN